MGQASYRIDKILRNFGMHSGFYTVRNLLCFSKPKDPADTLEKSGIYRLSCTSCNAVPHRANWALSSRTSHRTPNDVTKNQPYKSAFARHVLDTRHPDAEISLLHEAVKGRFMNKLEEIEIFRNMHNHDVTLLNTTENVFFNQFVSFMYAPVELSASPDDG